MKKKSKYDFILYGVMAVLFIVPLATTESMIVSCELCQGLIRAVSSIIPGIDVMSGVSKLPQTISLEISLVWIFVPFVAIFFYLAVLHQKITIDFKQKIKFVILFLIILGNEFWLGLYTRSSFFYGTIAIPHGERLLSNVVYLSIQNDVGVAIFSFFIMGLESALLMFSFIVLKQIIMWSLEKFSKGENKNV